MQLFLLFLGQNKCYTGNSRNRRNGKDCCIAGRFFTFVRIRICGGAVVAVTAAVAATAAEQTGDCINNPANETADTAGKGGVSRLY